jgi:CubicO group peptidase (beta-lactamase class C family)
VAVSDQLQRLLDRAVDKERVRGVLAAVQSADGVVNASAAAGFADADLTVPLIPQTPYFLASITKMYTAVVVMQLAREGTVRLETPISDYLSSELTSGLHVIDGTDRGSTITVEQLLFQTSGLADYFAGKQKGEPSLEHALYAGLDRALTIEDVVALARTLPPKFSPGAGRGRKAHYSDTNYALLGAIIAAVTGESVATCFEQRVFTPLGLESTFVFDHNRPWPTAATMWHKDVALDIPLAMSSFPADGGVVATLDDSLRFLRGFFSGMLLSERELAYMTSRWNRIFFPMQYGGGVMRFYLPRWLSPFKNPGELVGHSGSSGSFNFYSRHRGVFVAGTVNQSDSPGRPFRLMPQILDLAR